MKRHILFCCLIVVTWSIQARASILAADEKTITFQPNKIPAGTTWHPEFTLTDNGLVFRELPPNGLQESWVQTEPFPIGYSWRPPYSAGFRIFLDGSFAETKGSGEPRIYLRYGCDKEHWSTWYEARLTEEKNPEGLKMYQARVSVPDVARARYISMMQDWWKSGPAWTSDETEYAQWLVQKEPAFFDKEFPFIGYVQVRLEKSSTHSREQVKSLTVGYTWAISGLTSHVSDKSRVRKNTDNKWFFTGSGN